MKGLIVNPIVIDFGSRLGYYNTEMSTVFKTPIVGLKLKSQYEYMSRFKGHYISLVIL